MHSSNSYRHEEVEFNGTHLYVVGPATQANYDSDSLGVAAWYINQETGMYFNT